MPDVAGAKGSGNSPCRENRRSRAMIADRNADAAMEFRIPYFVTAATIEVSGISIGPMGCGP